MSGEPLNTNEGAAMTGTTTHAGEQRAKLRDVIVAAVARELRVPVADIVRSQGTHTERALDARAIVMWVLSADVDRLGVPELIELFRTTEKTIEIAWRRAAHQPELNAIAARLIEEHAEVLVALPVVRDGDEE